ncbi:lipoprotein [Halomonas sp. M4R1S46]|nr:lipoprotein [Halomonas sp. M4R1S46]UYG07907.1 lipoprotein [Halomonas sp. M4R1S46]
MRRTALLALLALPLLLAGCGQKGPLYLPGDTAAEERYGPRDPETTDDASDAAASGADAPRPADEDDT